VYKKQALPYDIAKWCLLSYKHDMYMCYKMFFYNYLCNFLDSKIQYCPMYTICNVFFQDAGAEK